MNMPVRILLRAGAEASMVEDFRVLAEATDSVGNPRYQERPTLEALARFIARGAGGPNRDAALYELCHLVNAVDAAGRARDRRSAFFLGPEAASPARFRARLDAALTCGGWRREGLTRTAEGITLHYRDGEFTVRFGRMPFLAALYEFLAGMEEFNFFAELQTIFDPMTAQPGELKTVQGASNRLSSHLRQYRRRHLAMAQQEGKFEVILGFLSARAPAGTLHIDDTAVLDFWLEKAGAGDFRAYRTVFEAFTHFIRALDETGRAEAMLQAAPVGIDRESGEIEPEDSAAHPSAPAEWASPLALLDQAPASEIKFLKKDSERKPLEPLMQHGPMALRLPLAFLRLEAFGPIQSAITTDLQVGRGAASVVRRIACTDAQSYAAIVAQFAHLKELLGRLQKAAFYALHKRTSWTQPQVVSLVEPHVLFDQARAQVEDSGVLPDGAAIEALMMEAERTFRAVTRKGFDEAGLADEARIEGFRIGAVALVAAARQLEAYLAVISRVGGQALETRFDADKSLFSARFAELYGVA